MWRDEGYVRRPTFSYWALGRTEIEKKPDYFMISCLIFMILYNTLRSVFR